MSLPVVLVDSATGSDTAASGAGPSTALSGSSNASTSGTGLVVTLPSGTVLTGVSTTGSDVIYLADSTAGARNFGKITATSGSGGATPTVTVANAFGPSLAGKSWAIGGKRASIGSATSMRLYNNNGGAGDMAPGWAIEMQSGHAETLSAGLSTWRAGDTTAGAVTIRGAPGAATEPVLTFSGAATGSYAIVPRGNYQVFEGFTIKDSTGHGLVAFAGTTANFIRIKDLACDDATSYFNKFIDAGGTAYKVTRCKVKTSGQAVAITGAPFTIEGCDVHDCGGGGIDTTGTDPLGIVIEENLIRTCAGPGIVLDLGGANVSRTSRVARNTVDGCTGASSDGIQVKGTIGDVLGNLIVEDNVASNNGRYGINFGVATDGQLLGYLPRVADNNTYNNTSNAYHSATSSYASNACPWASGDPGVNPTYASSSDWTPTNTALQAATSVAGYP